MAKGMKHGYNMKKNTDMTKSGSNMSKLDGSSIASKSGNPPHDHKQVYVAAPGSKCMSTSRKLV